MMSEERCNDCGDPVSDALARTIQLSVDHAEIDCQRLCPNCFAAWINRYDEEMRNDLPTIPDGENSEIIVD